MTDQPPTRTEAQPDSLTVEIVARINGEEFTLGEAVIERDTNWAATLSSALHAVANGMDDAIREEFPEESR
jgi:hypothetical protein